MITLERLKQVFSHDLDSDTEFQISLRVTVSCKYLAGAD